MSGEINAGKNMNVTRTKAKNWLHNVLSTVMAQNI